MESVEMAIARASGEKGKEPLPFFVIDRIVRARTFLALYERGLMGPLESGCSSLGIECGEDCSNLKVCVIVLGCLKCSFPFLQYDDQGFNQ